VNPYEPTTEPGASKAVVKPTVSLNQKLGMLENRLRLAIVLLIGSIAALAWMWVGGLVTYVPGTVSPNEMQNIYLSRILLYGLLSGVLQIAAIALIVTQRRSTGDENEGRTKR
jgi:hypothetical protein